MTLTIKQKVGDWKKSAINDPPDVKTVQKLLTAVAKKLKDPSIKPRGINGVITRPPKKSSTVIAIIAFQRQVLRMKTPDGRVDPGGRTITALNRLIDSKGFEKLPEVKQDLQKKVYSFIADFAAVTITSGKRTVNKQAELMTPMSDSDLNMYGTTTYYIVEIKDIPKTTRTVAKVEKILEKAQKNGSRISHHIVGNAVDISARGAFDWTKANKIAKKVGLTTKNEKSRNCFHVQL